MKSIRERFNPNKNSDIETINNPGTIVFFLPYLSDTDPASGNIKKAIMGGIVNMAPICPGDNPKSLDAINGKSVN